MRVLILGNVLRTKLGRYILVGGIVYVIELIVILAAQRVGLSSLLAVALSFWVGLLISFMLQKFFTFGDHRTQRGIVITQFLATTALVLFNFAFTLLVTQLFNHTLPPIATRTVALGITTFWNFYLYQTKLFKSSVEPMPID